jgi:hypothetical protein
MMGDLTPQVEPPSIDEAFLDLTGTERLHGMMPADARSAIARKRSDGATRWHRSPSIALADSDVDVVRLAQARDYGRPACCCSVRIALSMASWTSASSVQVAESMKGFGPPSFIFAYFSCMLY